MHKHRHTKDGEPLCNLHGEGEPDLDSNECDSPQNCIECGKPCNYSLTEAGVDYVIEQIQETLDAGRDSWNVNCVDPRSWYRDCRHVEIIRDWADDLKSYKLTDRDAWLVNYFLKLTEAPKTNG